MSAPASAAAVLRAAVAEDGPFIAAMLAEAASWERSPGEPPYPIDGLLAIPQIADYVEGWGRPGDGGVIAVVDGEPAGAGWFRRFTADHPGYGFIAEDVPGLGLGVVPAFRRRGLGTTLLAATVRSARKQGARTVSLSVSERNAGARRLYDRAGFIVIGREGDSLSMRLDLDVGAASEAEGDAAPEKV
jgi:ribosomal protein S18 acetylase RimI-like enzyme